MTTKPDTTVEMTVNVSERIANYGSDATLEAEIALYIAARQANAFKRLIATGTDSSSADAN
jgi:hypothetical protein